MYGASASAAVNAAGSELEIDRTGHAAVIA